MSDKKRKSLLDDDEYEAGATAAEETAERKKKDKDLSSPEIGVKPNKTKSIVLAISMTVVVLIIGFFVVMFASGSWLSGFEPKKPDGLGVNADDKALEEVRKQEAERVRIGAMSDIQKANEKIEVLEGYIRQIVGTFESSDIKTIMAQLDDEKRERALIQGMLDQVIDDNNELRKAIMEARSQMDLARQQGQQGEPEPEPEPEPLPPPSSSQTTILNNFGQYVSEKKAAADKAAADKAAEDEKSPVFDDRLGIPAAGLVKAVLTTKIVSTQNLENFFVQAQTTEDVEVSRGYLLPKGSVFYGKAMPDFESRRLGVTIEGVRVGHIQIPMEGVLLDKHGSPGLVSKYVDPFWRNLWLSMIPQAAAYALVDKDEKVTTEKDKDGKDTTTTTEVGARTQILRDTAQTVAQQIADHGKQERPTIIMNSGLPVIVQFTKKLPLDVLVQAGGASLVDTRRFKRDNPFAVPREEYVTVGPGHAILGWNALQGDSEGESAGAGSSVTAPRQSSKLWMGSFSDGTHPKQEKPKRPKPAPQGRK